MESSNPGANARSEISNMAANLESILGKLRRDIAATEAKLSGLKTAEDDLAPDLKASGRSSPPSSNGQLLSEFEAGQKMFAEEGQALGTREILQRMIDGGYVTPSNDAHRRQLVNSIFSVMRRKSDIFDKAGRGTWGLTAWKVKG